MPINYNVFGGEVPKIPARNLTNGYAAVAIDVDLSRGTLRPWAKDALIDGSKRSQRNIMVEDCVVQSSDRCIDVARVTLPCKRYFRTGVAGYPEQAALPGGPWHRLGIPTLHQAPKAWPIVWEPIPSPHGLIPGVVDPAETQTTDKVIERRYLYTVVDIFDQESQGSVPSEPFLADWDEPTRVSGFAVPAGVPAKEIRLYSTAPGLQTDETPRASDESFFLVATLPPGTLSYAHHPASTNYGELYQNHIWYEPPTDLGSIQHWGTNQLAGLSGGKMYFSHPNAYHAWPLDYVLAFHSPALALVCTEQYGYALTCGMPEVVDLRHDCAGGKCHETRRIEEQFPIIGIRSAVGHDGSAIYASADGLVMLTGTRARLITANLFTRDQWLAIHPNTMVGVVYDGFYFGATDNYAFRMRIPDEAYESNQRNLLTQLSIRATSFYRSMTDRLYFSDADGVWEWAAGRGYKPFLWRGPIETVDGRRPLAAAEIASDGTVEFKLIHRDRVQFERPVVGHRSFRLPTWATGQDIQVELSGTGEVDRVKLASTMGVLATLG